MKVLIIGAPTSEGYKCFGINSFISGGGWLENLVNALANTDSLQMYVCFYSASASTLQCKQYNGKTYIALPAHDKRLNHCTPAMIDDLKELLSLVSPDVVHIIGTEREYALKLLELAGVESTVVSITGLVSICAKHYFAGIDKHNFTIPSLGDFLRNGGPLKEKKLFQKLGVSEETLISKAIHFFGRTSWDLACIQSINPSAKYYYCSEILNPIYHQNRWNINSSVKHRIFVSQASYPLKGFHILLEAFPKILEKYPDSEIYIGGPNILKGATIIDKIKRTTYARYIGKLIRKLHIPENKIHFTGPLDANQMLEQYLKCNVFVLPSAIENSPNSLGEAMLLGVPCVASCVGGVQDMIKDRHDGLIYPFDESYMLSYYICKIFSDDDFAKSIGQNAHNSAKIRFNIEDVVRTTTEVYSNIFKNKENN